MAMVTNDQVRLERLRDKRRSGSARIEGKAMNRILDRILVRILVPAAAKPTLTTMLALLATLVCTGARPEAPGNGPFKVGSTMRRVVPPGPYEWRGAATHALLTAVWYPADSQAQARPQLIGPPNAPPLFEADDAAPDAALEPGREKFPLILMSHGTGGTAQSMAWLATALAARGFIVAGVNHPGNNALEPYTAQGFMLWWRRAQDISVALDAMLADPVFGPRIDRERIGAMGFSLGGYTMIALAGGITSRARFRNICETRTPDEASCKAPPEFSDLRAQSEALERSDPAYAAALNEGGRSYREPRIRAVFAIAPALGPVFTPESLAAVTTPVAIVAGAGDAIVPVDASAKRVAAEIPHAELTIFPGGVGHYTFVDICTATGRRIVPPLCVDAPDVDRAAVHRTTVGLAAAFFDARLR
jgi:predicted dienelactone hydrolase